MAFGGLDFLNHKAQKKIKSGDHPMNKTGRVLLALLLAPWATIIGAILHAIFLSLVFDHEHAALGVTFFFIYGLVFSYPATLFVGMPVYFLISRLKLKVHYLIQYFAAGAILAYLVLGLMFGLFPPFPVGREAWLEHAHLASLFIFMGTAVSVAFGLIAGKAVPIETNDNLP